MGGNKNGLLVNGREWECKKPFPVTSSAESRTFLKVLKYDLSKLEAFHQRCQIVNAKSSVSAGTTLSETLKLRLLRTFLSYVT